MREESGGLCAHHWALYELSHEIRTSSGNYVNQTDPCAVYNDGNTAYHQTLPPWHPSDYESCRRPGTTSSKHQRFELQRHLDAMGLLLCQNLVMGEKEKGSSTNLKFLAIGETTTRHAWGSAAVAAE
jgi:hypothetical protein